MPDVIVDATEPIALVGGAEIAPEVIKILQTITDIFVAADGGADHLLANHIIPRAVIGDFDSISPAARQKFAPQLVHNGDEDTTDLDKVLNRIAAPAIVGAGFLGGRLDHSFASLNVLARFSDKSLFLISEVDCCFRCPDQGLSITLPIGTAISVLPMDHLLATSSGLQWDMNRLPLHPAGFVSLSNRTVCEAVQINVTGPALITLPVAHLETAIAAVRAV